MENSLDKLAQYILNKAVSDAKVLYETAVQDTERVRSENDIKFEEMLASQKESLSLKSRQNIEDVVRQKKDRLHKEKTQQADALIDRLFEETENKLCDMLSEDFLKFYHNEIGKLDLNGKFAVILGERTAKNLSEQHQGMLEAETKRYCISLEKNTIPNQGGFVLQQLPIEYSFLFSDMLDEIKRHEGPELLKRFINGRK